MAIDGAPPALLDGAPSARLPESEAGVEWEASIQVRPIEQPNQLIGFVASVAPTQIHVVRVEEEEEIRAA